jgi:hypothetical protein
MKDAKIYIAGHDISGHSNKVELKYTAEILDDTTFGASSKSRVAGLKDTDLSVEGFWEAASTAATSYKIDDIVNAYLCTADTLITVCPTDGSQGEVAFCIPGMLGEYQFGASVGELTKFTLNGGGNSDLIRGTVMENEQKTSSASGTAQELGAVSASQHLYAGIHCYAAEGTLPTLDVTIESDDAEGFLDPTTRVTFDQLTTIGSEWATPIAGAIADTWWRVKWVTGGTSPKFTIVVVVGIQ